MVFQGGWVFIMSEVPLYPPVASTVVETGVPPYPIAAAVQVPCTLLRRCFSLTSYRDTSLSRNSPLLGPYSRLYLESYGGPRGWGGVFGTSTVAETGVPPYPISAVQVQ